MIIFLYGPDTYRSKQKLNEIIGRYKKIHKSGLNLKYFDFKKDNFEDFRDAFKSSTMFKEKKSMVLENVFLNSQIENDFLKFSKDLSKSNEIILIYEEKVDKNKSLFKQLNKIGKSQKFELLGGNSLKNWVKKEFQKYSAPHQNPEGEPQYYNEVEYGAQQVPHEAGKFGTGQVKIRPESLDLLIDYVGNDLWQMANEIKKLVNYVGEGEIQKKDVELLVKPKIETDIFKTIDAVASKNKSKALSLVKEHLEKGDSPPYLLAMINFQFRNLLMIKDLVEKNKYFYRHPRSIKFEISRKIGMHPFLVEKTLSQARKFELEELKKIYQKIFQADLNIKTGKMEPEAALETLLNEI